MSTKPERSVTGSHGRKSNLQHDLKQVVAVGICCNVNNVYAIDESKSRFCAEIIINLTWIDPNLAHALENGSMQADLEPAGLWEDFKPGWMFKDFDSPQFADYTDYKSAKIVNDVVDNRPKPTLSNEVENYVIVEDAVSLLSLETGRVAYAITVKAAFDEVFELPAFPFDDQVLDIRMYSEASDLYRFVFESHPLEKNGFYGAWKYNRQRTKIVEHPEWLMDPHLDDHFDEFTSSGSNNTYSRYTLRMYIERRGGFYITNVAAVVSIFVILGIGVFVIPVVEFSNRFSNLLALLLAITAFRIVVVDKLPKVSYWTIADKYLLTAFVLYALLGCESMIVFKISEKSESDADVVDDCCLYIYIFVWVAIHLLLAMDVKRARSNSTLLRSEATGWCVLPDGKKMIMKRDTETNQYETVVTPYRGLATSNSRL